MPLFNPCGAEVIQETSYDGKADIWSLGITLMELCEGSPPHFSVHPMRAIFIISSRPAPTLKEPEKWSPELQDFLGQCLVKDCEKRASAAELLRHPWIKKAVKEIGSGGKASPVLEELIGNNWESIERVRVARFKLPENIPVGDGNNIPAPAEEVPDSKSRDDESNLATLRNTTLRANSMGIPATRQQLRNASLSRSATPSATRGRASSRAFYNNDGNEAGGGDYGTLVVRPVNGSQQNGGTFVRVLPEAKYSSNEPSQNKSSSYRSGEDQRSPEMTRDGTLVKQKPLGLAEEINREPSASRNRAEGKDSGKTDIQAALKYFRDEPAAPEPKPKRDVSSKEVYRNNSTEQPQSKPVASNPSKPKVLEREESDYAILNGMTIEESAEEEHKESLKRVRGLIHHDTFSRWPFINLCSFCSMFIGNNASNIVFKETIQRRS